MPFLFIICLLIVFGVFKNKTKPLTDSLPFPKSPPSKIPTLVPSPTPTIIQNIYEIDNDLKNIYQDLQKIKNEELRLIPPVFIFQF